MKKIIFGIVLVILILPFFASATTYYVAKDGSGDFTTIQAAANAVSAGDTVIVKAGDYASERVSVTNSGSSGAPITFQAQGTVVMKGFKITANYITVKGFEIANTDYRRWDRGLSACVYVKGNNVIIEENYVHDCSLTGIYLHGPPGDNLITHDCIVRNNRIFRVETVGIDVSGRNNLIEGNEVWETAQCHPNLVAVEGPGCPSYAAVSGLDADGMRFFGQGHIFRQNNIHDIHKGPAGINPSIGDYNDNPHIDCFQTWVGANNELAQNIVFERNYCENLNPGMYVFMLEGGAHHLTIKNNIFWSAGGINTGGGADYLYVYNNLWANNLSFGSQGYPGAIGLQNVPHAVIKNNIFYDQPYHTVTAIGNTANIDIDYNLAFNSDGTTPFCIRWGNYDTCQPSPNNEMWGIDPLFVNPDNRDFHLQAGSPAIDAGTDLSGLLNNDYDGNPRPQGSSYDIGAFEYTSGAPPPTCTENDWSYTDDPCQPSNTLTRTWTKIGTCTGGVTHPPTETISCTYNPPVLPGLSWEAEDGIITPPLSVTSGYVSQAVETDVSSGGKASYNFNINNPGDYIIKAIVNAPNTGANSFFINIDGEPTDPTMIWDIINLTNGFEERKVSWRGSGTPDNNEFVTKIFTLSVGEHELIIRGREANTLLDKINIEAYTITEPIPGDLNNDGSVDIADLIIVARNFGLTSGFDSEADTDNNNVIDIFDVVFVASRFT